MTLAVIPARGGSRELRHKNLLPDANGVPLVLASALAARDAGCRVIVSTDDSDIASIAAVNGFDVHHRGPELADVPVDDVVTAVASDTHIGDGGIILIQPTVQPITPELVSWFLTHRGSQPTAAGVEDRHLTWHDGDCLSPRAERQTDQVWPVREVGIRWWPALPLGAPATVTPVPASFLPLIDIDTAVDYKALSGGGNILIRVTGNERVGLGHVRRGVLLAERLQHHNVTFAFTDDTSNVAFEYVETRGWDTAGTHGSHHDLTIVDTLDDDTRFDTPTLHLENSHPNRHATATINAMYQTPDAYCGARWADIRPEFTHTPYTVRDDAENILVLFGGTDPAGLGKRVSELITDNTRFGMDWIAPYDERSVASAMQQADLLLTSGGRTVFEAAAVGIPTIVLTQNLRETTHTHLGVGNLNLGLGALAADDDILRTVQTVAANSVLRRELSDTGKASVDGKGVDRIVDMAEWVMRYGDTP